MENLVRLNRRLLIPHKTPDDDKYNSSQRSHQDHIPRARGNIEHLAGH